MKKSFKNNRNKNKSKTYNSKIAKERTLYFLGYSCAAIAIVIISIYICIVCNKRVETMIETQNSKWDTIQIP